jgi:hypothetical protein
MSDIWEGLIGAFVGAAAIVVGGILTEGYKRHHDMKATASAIAGEIFSILDMTARRGHVESFQTIANTLKRGEPFDIPNVVGSGLEGKLDPVVEAHFDRLGLLDGNRLPERIAQFYTMLRGIRIDIVNLSRGVFDKNKDNKAGLIQEDLVIWDINRKLGQELCEELRQIAATSWWPIASIKWGWKNLKSVFDKIPLH